MASEDVPRVRPEQAEEDRRRDAASAALRLSQGNYPPNQDFGSAPPWAPGPVGVPEEPVESEEDRIARERREFIQSADDTEIIDGGVSTIAYRRAIAVFDETDDRLQLGEHWHYTDADYEKNGRF